MNQRAHPWLPVSPCGDGCLPAAGTVPAAGSARQLLRIAAVATMVLVGLVLVAPRCGTVFVDRERLSTLPQTIAAVSGALAGGAAVGAFPEATTWCGMAGGRFRPAIFQAAVETATPVRPVALRYRLAGAGITTVASFVGAATLCEAVVLLTGVRGLVVEVELLPVLPAQGVDRRALAAQAGAAVGDASQPHPSATLGWCCDDVPRPRRHHSDAA
ncbi:MAG: 1-acyl-sn-glycerol-3-phosphate acyltransferase [Pseudonocardiaceae bacterium]